MNPKRLMAEWMYDRRDGMPAQKEGKVTPVEEEKKPQVDQRGGFTMYWRMTHKICLTLNRYFDLY